MLPFVFQGHKCHNKINTNCHLPVRHHLCPEVHHRCSEVVLVHAQHQLQRHPGARRRLDSSDSDETTQPGN